MTIDPSRPLAVAVVIKQVPRIDSLRLRADGHVDRTGVELEMNPYCRRAVAQAVEIASATGGRCVVVTLGPPAAEDCLREALACGADEAVLVSDPAFAGSDTLATAHALAAALRRLGPFDLVLCGRNSVDADTGQVPAELAELLDLPMAAAVRAVDITGEELRVHCEHDDGWVDMRLRMPALLSCAERLIAPAKAGPEQRARVPAERIRRLDARSLGSGPWGQAGSPTVVGAVTARVIERSRLRFAGDVAEQVERAVEALVERGAFDPVPQAPLLTVPVPRGFASGGMVAVLVEPGRPRAARELLGAAARLAVSTGGPVVALTLSMERPQPFGAWGADVVQTIIGAHLPEDLVEGLAAWCDDHRPRAILAPSTIWGREAAGRLAARLGHGLVGDAVDLAVDRCGRLLCEKPALGSSLVATVSATSPTTLVTLRCGSLPLLRPRACAAWEAAPIRVEPRGRLTVLGHERDDEMDALATSRVVVAVGAGVAPDDYGRLRPLLDALGAELAATRKVTDAGWLPRSRQVGITGRSVTPRLFVAVGSSGRLNHMIGARGATTVLAINRDADAPVLDVADVGIVGDWRDVVPVLTRAVQRIGCVAAPGVAKMPA